MRKFIEIVEGVDISNIKRLAAFTLVVAESYADAPLYDNGAKKSWDALMEHTKNVLFKRLSGSGIKLVYTADDPYASLTDDVQMMIKYMLYDITVNNELKIYTGYSTHPVFSERENHIFRAVHDFFTHGTLRSTFSNQIKTIARQLHINKLPDLEHAHELLSKVNLHLDGNKGISFGLRGELNAGSKHILLAPSAAAGAIFTEVIGQVCYQIIVGDFPEQKVAILHGFNFEKIGQCLPDSPQERRMNDILSHIDNGTEIETQFGNMPIPLLLSKVSR